MVEKLTGKDDLILALNSGSSSLKFGIFYRGAAEEEPLLTGSAEGIGHSNGSLHIRSSDGKPLILREGILESQSDALSALGAAVQEHIHNTTPPLPPCASAICGVAPVPSPPIP